MITIEKGIPVPPKKPSRYPFDQMEVGDSFAVPAGADPRKTRSRVTSFGSNFSKRHPSFKFVTRTVGDTVRCWRVAVHPLVDVAPEPKVRVHILKDDDQPKRVIHGKRY